MTDVSSIASGSQIQSASSQARSKLGDDLDSFLFILTTQLKNQDPLSPMDSNEFTNQLVQFAGVEQSIKTNEHLESLIKINNTSLTTAALSYMGKDVQVESVGLPLQEGHAKFSYTLDQDVETCVVAIYDYTGTIVYATPGDKLAGRYVIEWDGIGSDGEQYPDGSYYVGITALSKEGEVSPYVTTFGRVTGVAHDDAGNVAVGLGDIVVDMSKVLAVHERTASNASGGGSGSEDTSGG